MTDELPSIGGIVELWVDGHEVPCRDYSMAVLKSSFRVHVFVTIPTVNTGRRYSDVVAAIA